MIVMFKVPKVIDKIQFGILSPDDIRKMSVLRVITADTYDDDGYPIEKGLMDQRLGVIDPGLKCKTCGQKFGDCSGHFGHIELARPVIHVGHAKDVHKILKSVCRDCGKLKLDDSQREHYQEQLKHTSDRLKSKETVIKEAMDKAAKSVCPWCGSDKRNIKFEKP
ncbi:MAG: DNA-directed RNA polymerase subunit A', partial [Candidatus Methanofastidiosa archaeon]|nr:DNA-directed RNA polymerase subunit A' [Candidatus Methanofastidiosa archaeon]